MKTIILALLAFGAFFLGFSLSLRAEESKPVDAALKNRMVTELAAALNDRTNPIRAKLLNFYKDCDDQWNGCFSEWLQLQESGSSKFDFIADRVAKYKLSSIVYLSSSHNDLCPKSNCNPTEAGEDEYLLIWQEGLGMKWGSDLNSVIFISAKLAYQKLDDGKYANGNGKVKKVSQGKFKFSLKQNGLN